MIEFLMQLAENGVMGIVAAIAIAFGWYQTKRSEKIHDQQIKDLKQFAYTLADIFKLNTEGQQDDKPKTNPRIPSLGTQRESKKLDERSEESAKGEGD